MNILCNMYQKRIKRYKNKNFRVLHDTSNFYTLEIAKKSKIFNKIIISAEPKKIMKFSENLLTMLLKDLKS